MWVQIPPTAPDISAQDDDLELFYLTKKEGMLLNTGWIKVFTAAILEIIWITGLKYAVSPLEWVMTAAAWAVCSYFFITASNTLPVATAYCVFTGLGALGTLLVEVFCFNFTLDHTRIILIVLLMTGIIGLKLCTEEQR